MNRVTWALVVLLVGLLQAGFAHGQSTRTWVSAVGDDAFPCSRTAPCQTFAAALANTAAGGEISVLDPGDFGPLTITQALTISGDGTLAGITVTTGNNGINVQAGATDVVVLRNISLANDGGTHGIRFVSGRQLIIDRCAIVGMGQSGVEVDLTADALLTVTNTSITGGVNGIRINSTGRLDAQINDVDIRRSGNGINVQSGLVSIRNSLIVHNTNVGVLTQAGKVAIENTKINGNDVAVQVLGGFARLSNSSFYNNQNGLVCTGGPITSAYNNRKGGNVGGSLPACPEPLPPMTIL